MDRVVELSGVAADHPAVAEQVRNGLVAAFWNEMRGIFLDLGAAISGATEGCFLKMSSNCAGEVWLSAKSDTRQPMPIEMLSLLV